MKHQKSIVSILMLLLLESGFSAAFAVKKIVVLSDIHVMDESLLDSPTEYYIIVDTQNCYIMIFKGSIGQWKLNKIYPISCGKPGHETPTGFYWVTDKLPYFYSHGSLCYYATQWNGPYYFHSVTYNYNGTIQNGNLGMHISAGCVRCRIDVAEWIYDNIPIGTAVRIM